MRDEPAEEGSSAAEPKEVLKSMLGPLGREFHPVPKFAQIQPGYYVDEIGEEYFYLTGLYALVIDRILENPSLNTPGFVAAVLDGIRSELKRMSCIELMD